MPAVSNCSFLRGLICSKLQLTKVKAALRYCNLNSQSSGPKCPRLFSFFNVAFFLNANPMHAAAPNLLERSRSECRRGGLFLQVWRHQLMFVERRDTGNNPSMHDRQNSLTYSPMQEINLISPAEWLTGVFSLKPSSDRLPSCCSPWRHTLIRELLEIHT